MISRLYVKLNKRNSELKLNYSAMLDFFDAAI
jgi:hypothetical protein